MAKIEEDMISMAKNMKEVASNFKQQFTEDAKVMSFIGQSQDSNLQKTDEEVDRIAGTRKTITTGFWQRIIMLLVALAVFAFMVIFIRLWPHKSFKYISKMKQSELT